MANTAGGSSPRLAGTCGSRRNRTLSPHRRRSRCGSEIASSGILRRGPGFAKRRVSTLLSVLLCSLAVVCGNAKSDKHTVACSCSHDDNWWINVITELLTVTQGGTLHRTLMNEGTNRNKRLKGFIDRLQCDAEASTYAQTEMPFNVEQLAMVVDTAPDDTVAQQELSTFCVPGQVVLSVVCVHKFLLQGTWSSAVKWVQALQNLLSFAQDCMESHSPFPVRVGDLEDWIDLWRTQPIPTGLLSQEASRLVDVAAFKGNITMHPKVAKTWAHCLPLKDLTCFPAGTTNANEVCESCCDQKRWGETGDPNCWAGPFTFERCCHKSQGDLVSDVESSTQDEDAPVVVTGTQGLKKQSEEKNQLEESLQRQIKDLSAKLLAAEGSNKLLQEKSNQLEESLQRQVKDVSAKLLAAEGSNKLLQEASDENAKVKEKSEEREAALRKAVTREESLQRQIKDLNTKLLAGESNEKLLKEKVKESETALRKAVTREQSLERHVKDLNAKLLAAENSKKLLKEASEESAKLEATQATSFAKGGLKAWLAARERSERMWLAALVGLAMLPATYFARRFARTSDEASALKSPRGGGDTMQANGKSKARGGRAGGGRVGGSSSGRKTDT
eukprot:TRINITY_DN5600_c0_g1_i1.p1 TRINITY_DN5600_c0_g1~~TRINITY_DN5600_c0_g1_i1.p1  ORF type:complete len:636 (+),score=118.55 TRINITY_DN5600_c0_g1_i1:60-1910(+)